MSSGSGDCLAGRRAEVKAVTVTNQLGRKRKGNYRLLRTYGLSCVVQLFTHLSSYLPVNPTEEDPVLLVGFCWEL